MNKEVLSVDFQDFIRSEKARDTLSSGVFSSPFSGVSPSELSVQIKGWNKACEKLPQLAARRNVVYPSGVSMEQCSGLPAAVYKASLVPSGVRCADITGGFGSDTLSFSNRFQAVDYFEIDEGLAELATHNFGAVGAENITVHTGDGVAGVLESGMSYDLVYADPARRDVHARRVYDLSDCVPDIPPVAEILLEKSRRLLIKASPMLDIAATLRRLPGTAQVHVVAVKNEVKELLFLLEKGFSGSPDVFAADLLPEGAPRVFSAPWEGRAAVESAVAVESYVYDPSAALRKAGLCDGYCASLGLKKIHPGTLLYTSDEFCADFRGRVFRVEAVTDSRGVKKLLAGRKAGVVVRNYPADAVSLKKKYGLKEDDVCFLLAFTGPDGKNTLAVVQKYIAAPLKF